MFPLDEEEKREKNGVMALKLDMSKAYDRLGWDFVIGTLSAMGFLELLIFLIHQRISNVSYQSLFNGQSNSSFVPKRGLRQGDPSLLIYLSFMLMFFQVC